MHPRLNSQVVLPGLFLLGALLAFSTNLNSYFLSDDFVQIGKVLRGDFSVAWGQVHGGFFRPLFILSYIIDSRVWHERPLGYHLTNVLVHALNSFLLFRMGLKLFRNSSLPATSIRAAAAASAALFLLHPSHSEAVNWISGRADLIATFFCLASLLSFCVYADAGRSIHLILGLAFSTLALLAKESAVCLPFLILITVAYLSQRRAAVIAFGASALILIAFILLRGRFLGAIVGGYGISQHLNFAPGWIRDRLLEAAVRSIAPALPASWSWFLFKPLQSPFFIGIAVASLGLLAAAVIIRRRQYYDRARQRQNGLLLVIGSLFLVSLLPVINLRLNLYDSLGERFLYLPTLFSCLLIGFVLTIMVRSQKIWLVLLICALGFYSWRLYAANRLWHDAAELTRSIKDEFSTNLPGSRLMILNAPDNLRGVPVFHNGLPEALQVFTTQSRVESVEISAYQTLKSRFDETTLHEAGDAFTLQPVNLLDTFDRAASSKCVQLLHSSVNQLEFRRLPCLDQTDVYFFSGGKMRKSFE